MTVKIKGNKQLFDEISGLGDQVKMFGGIVQNDMEITEEQLLLIEAISEEVINGIKNWKEKVKEHIKEYQ